VEFLLEIIGESRHQDIGVGLFMDWGESILRMIFGRHIQEVA